MDLESLVEELGATLKNVYCFSMFAHSETEKFSIRQFLDYALIGVKL